MLMLQKDRYALFLALCADVDVTEGSICLSDVNEDSLDHNLRLLQAYGMCELADELRKNHAQRHQKDDDINNGVIYADSDIDEQEAWNKQIEEDSKNLAMSADCSPNKKLKIE